MPHTPSVERTRLSTPASPHRTSSPADITTESMRAAFVQYAETHAATSVRRCWSTWKVLCE